MAKYRVTAPLAYSRPTGRPSTRRGVSTDEVVRCAVGDIIELDDTAALYLSRKVEPHWEEPSKPPRRKIKATKLDGSAVPYGGCVEVVRDESAAPDEVVGEPPASNEPESEA